MSTFFNTACLIVSEIKKTLWTVKLMDLKLNACIKICSSKIRLVPDDLLLQHLSR